MGTASSSRHEQSPVFPHFSLVAHLTSFTPPHTHTLLSQGCKGIVLSPAILLRFHAGNCSRMRPGCFTCFSLSLDKSDYACFPHVPDRGQQITEFRREALYQAALGTLSKIYSGALRDTRSVLSLQHFLIYPEDMP